VPTTALVRAWPGSCVTSPRADEASAEGTAVERTMRIVELTRALAGAVTGHDVADVMATHMVPLFGAKGVSVWTHENGRAFLMGSAGPRVSLRRFEDARIAELPASTQAFIDGTLDFISSAEEFISRFPALADLAAAIGAQAWAILPLIASGRTVGASCVIYEHRHAFSHEERTLFAAMSGMVAQAMERARLYDAEHRRAQELQRGLLPRCLPALPAVTASARYQPAGDGTVAGGDWYDVIPLSAEQVALVVGDVMGHGVSEAVTMGRLRTAGHTLADLEQPLDELIMTTELVASELVGNVVRHARGPITLRLLRGRTLICEVADASPAMPRIRRAADTDENGRGLQLIAAVTSRWGAHYTGSGKCIWTEQLLSTDPLGERVSYESV
jgi:hypothetical protein